MAKGGAYEREICKELSLWWTDGERDDIFWRSSNSGGRATMRRKIGKKTAGQYGDVAATDPSGVPFIEIFTTEIKRGYNKSTFYNDVIERLNSHSKKQKQWDKFVCQVTRDSKEAGSLGWLLITKRDRKEAVVFMPKKVAERVKFKNSRPGFEARVRLHNGKRIIVVCCRLSDFFKEVTPDNVKELHASLQKEK